MIRRKVRVKKRRKKKMMKWKIPMTRGTMPKPESLEDSWKMAKSQMTFWKCTMMMLCNLSSLECIEQLSSTNYFARTAKVSTSCATRTQNSWAGKRTWIHPLLLKNFGCALQHYAVAGFPRQWVGYANSTFKRKHLWGQRILAPCQSVCRTNQANHWWNAAEEWSCTVVCGWIRRHFQFHELKALGKVWAKLWRWTWTISSLEKGQKYFGLGKCNLSRIFINWHAQQAISFASSSSRAQGCQVSLEGVAITNWRCKGCKWKVAKRFQQACGQSPRSSRWETYTKNEDNGRFADRKP